MLIHSPTYQLIPNPKIKIPGKTWQTSTSSTASEFDEGGLFFGEGIIPNPKTQASYTTDELGKNHSFDMDTYAIIATAQLIDTPTQFNKKTHQSKGVRQLLDWVQGELNKSNFFLKESIGQPQKLIETTYPYYFLHGNQRYFVSFSHSQTEVALIISDTPCAIDIELRPIAWRVAERFFHANELAIVREHYDNAPLLLSALWRIKECLIKYDGGTLTKGLGADLHRWLPQIMHAQTLITLDDSTSPYSDFAPNPKIKTPRKTWQTSTNGATSKLDDGDLLLNKDIILYNDNTRLISAIFAQKS